MKSVNAELEQGSEWDSRILFFGVLFLIGSFISTYDTDLWKGRYDLLFPLLAIGMSLVVLNILLRLFRPKLKVTLFEIKDGRLNICPIRNLQFSGWVAKAPVTIEISSISTIKAYDFYNVGNKAGMYWVCLELNNKHVIEFNFDNTNLLYDIIEFIQSSLPSVELIVDPKIKI